MVKKCRYNLGTGKYKISGCLAKTGRRVRIIRGGPRRIWKDEKGKLFVKLVGKYWKFPQEIDY